MSRYLGSKCRLCRREATKLFLKGEKCFSDKCAIEKRNYPPGIHGQRRRKVSDYGTHLREKQKNQDVRTDYWKGSSVTISKKRHVWKALRVKTCYRYLRDDLIM